MNSDTLRTYAVIFETPLREILLGGIRGGLRQPSEISLASACPQSGVAVDSPFRC